MIRLSLYLFVFLPIALVCNGQTPNLGVNYTFALFTAEGAFENTGETTIIGDIGTNAGIFSGFPDGKDVGTIHCIDAISLQAANDINVAYSYERNLTCETVIGSILGNNEILTPNVYCIGEATTVVGNLIFDAQGNPDAIFIIQIDGALSTAIHSTITVQNEASIQNIYWQINGAVSLGDSSLFRGTIIANGAISLMEHASLYGRGLTRAGAISLHNNIIEGITVINALPIQLVSFTAKQEGKNVLLNWVTASETNNAFFSIYCSKDGLTFVDIIKIPTNGNCTSEQYYSAVDANPFNGISYYKLNQTDRDGKSTYSKVVSVTIDDSFDFSIYPNPLTNEATVRIPNESNKSLYTLKIYSETGEEIACIKLNNTYTSFDTSNFQSGLYYFTLLENNISIQFGKLYSMH
jgi:hypothetical protein